MEFSTGNADHDRNIQNLLPRFSPANRAALLDYLRLRSLDSKPGTLYNYAQLLCLLDDHLNGASFSSLGRDELLDFLLSERQRTSEATVVMRTRQLKRFLTDEMGTLPESWVPVLRTKEPAPPDRANVLTQEDLHALLAACQTLTRPKWFHRPTMAQALVWVLWDTGFRIGEALSMRFCDVSFDGPKVRIKLDPKSKLLKTGPRTIEVLECGPALKAWMAMHPCPAPTRPIWISTRRQDPPRRMRPSTADNQVKLLASLADLHLKGDKPLSCHDFRHSSATRRAGWGEADLRLFHGWTRDSTMPSRYVHRHLDDLWQQVRREAGVNDTGLSTRADMGMKTCPTCAEDIKVAALKCRYCGEVLKPLA